MKNLKLFVVAIAIFALNINAVNANPIKPSEQLRSEIIDIIGDTYEDALNKEMLEVEILFTVNSKSEMIVLSVESNDRDAMRYFKNKLNYKKVSQKSNKPGEIYLLPIKLIQQ
jgi:hypothetical protein